MKKRLDEKLNQIRNKKVISSGNMTKNKEERINKKVSNNDDLNNEFTSDNNDIIKNRVLESKVCLLYTSRCV